MKIPVSWLNQFVDINIPIEEFADKMVWLGNAVEGIEDLGGEIENVVVGHILSVEKHPNADSLIICKVDVGQRVAQIVTGAPNVRSGDYVPVALSGAILPGGKKIKAGKLRGELSEGMLCSGPELGVPQELYPHCGDEGILIFQEEYAPGSPIQPILGIDEQVIDFEILANRPDCLSVQGLARESAVALGQRAKEVEVRVQEGSGDISERVRVSIQDEDLCLRYCARVVRNIKIQPSPMWMRKALNACGVRPINNIVDITNYVMLEMGQPMHAFDLSHVRGNHIVVRRAHQGEILRTLDEKDRVMSANMLVIADEIGATGLAGIMGGEGSEIKDSTREVLFEAACFLSSSVRVTSRELGMRTESSGRFERGVDVHGVRRALDRAAQLVEQLGAGQVVSGVIDVYPNPAAISPVNVSADYIRGLTGVRITDREIQSILTELRIQTTISDGILTCIPPADRQDITIGADIAEEVLRVYGYEKIPSTHMTGAIVQGRRGERSSFLRRTTNLLCGAGFFECKTYSFQSAKVFDQLCLPQEHPMRRCATLLNPLGEDYAVMRTTLFASMLQTLSLNASRGAEVIRLFEINARYLPGQLPIVDELPQERSTLSIGMAGSDADFYGIKGVVELLLQACGLQKRVTWRRSQAPYLHPGRSAALYLDGELAGEIGEAHPDVLENFGLTKRAFIGEIDLVTLIDKTAPMGEVTTLPRHPAVMRDLALIMEAEVPAGDVMNTISAAAGKLFEDISIFDVYTGAPIERGYKSVAYSLTLRAPDRTLTEEEIGGVYEKVIMACQKQHGAKLR